MSGGNGLLASLLPEHIVFRSPVVQSPIPGAGDPADVDDFGADFRELSEMEPDRPATGAIDGRHGRPTPIMTVLTPSQAVSRACVTPGLVARIGAPC